MAQQRTPTHAFDLLGYYYVFQLHWCQWSRANSEAFLESFLYKDKIFISFAKSMVPYLESPSLCGLAGVLLKGLLSSSHHQHHTCPSQSVTAHSPAFQWAPLQEQKSLLQSTQMIQHYYQSGENSHSWKMVTWISRIAENKQIWLH